MNVVVPGPSPCARVPSLYDLRGFRCVSHDDPLVPVVELISKHLRPDLPRIIIELGGGEGRFDLAERMRALGWDAIGLGRAASTSSTRKCVNEYRSELMAMEAPLASVVVARLAFYPQSDASSPRIYPWDQLKLDQRGLTRLCAEQHLPDPMVFPVRRSLRDDGIFVRTMRAEGVGTFADIPSEMMRRSGFIVEESVAEEFEGSGYITTVYRAVPRVDFGGALLFDLDGEVRRVDYESLLRRALTEDIRFVPETEDGVTLWSIKTPALPQPPG